jgi:peptidoglycan glycosyltransferase
MHPAMQRRRRQLLTRKIQGLRASRRRGLTTFFLAIVGVFVVMIGGSILGTAGGMLAAYNYFASDLPDPHILDEISLPQTSYVYDRTGARLLARFECQNRESVGFDQIPEPLVNATVAAEDRTFWTNDGIDYYAAIRAAYANLQAGEITQGASTLTQQMIDYAEVLAESQAGGPAAPSSSEQALGSLAPAATLPPEEGEQPAEEDVCQPPPPRNDPSIPDKIRENIFARNVTAAYPGREGKERILATYLNLVFYGHGSYGIKAAAANYFGITDLSQLSIAQSAFIAGLPQAPSFYDPYQNPAGEPGSEAAAGPALERRNFVLESMLRDGYITQAQHDEALATTWLDMKPSSITTPLLEPHFTYRVRTEAAQILEALGSQNPELDVRTGGYQITTTLDYDLQQVARELVNKWVANLADKNVGNGALVSIDSATGEIVAYIGSKDFNNRDDPRVQGEFDVAGLGLRQPGSAFKPITYSSAFKARAATVSTMFVDAATQFSLTSSSSYIPTNADIQEHGPVLAMDALRYSLNIPSVQMQYLVGAETTAQFAESMGIAPRDYIMGLDPGLTLTLGSVPVNLTNMTQAYSVFAEQGQLHQARTIREIRDRDGNIVYNLERSLDSTTTEPMTPAEAYLTHWILEGNTDPGRNLLWGERAMLVTPDGQRRPAGFKTGTTNDFRDVSGFGYVPGSLTTGVWMGNNNQEPMSNVLGVGLFSADGPLFLWHEFMQIALNQPWEWNDHTPVGQTTFEQPEGITNVTVCRYSGMAATNACSGTMTMPFLSDNLPPVDNVHGKGCLDLVQYVGQASPARPSTWVAAAQRWSDRMVSRDWGARGDPAQPENPNTRYRISPLYGNPGFPAICGRVTSTPKPSPSPGESGPPASPGPEPTVPPPPGNGGGPPGQNKPSPPQPGMLVPGLVALRRFHLKRGASRAADRARGS